MMATLRLPFVSDSPSNRVSFSPDRPPLIETALTSLYAHSSIEPQYVDCLMTPGREYCSEKRLRPLVGTLSRTRFSMVPARAAVYVSNRGVSEVTVTLWVISPN